MATATKRRQKAEGRRQKEAPDPRETEALRELGHVCQPKSFEHLRLDIPDHLRVTATITVGELENGNWVWGLDAESLETKRASHLIVPCELVETPDGYTSAHYTRCGALKGAAYELYEWAEDECWPRGALSAIKTFHDVRSHELTEQDCAKCGGPFRGDDRVGELCHACLGKPDAPADSDPRARTLLPAGATSTTPPAGIAVNDPEAQEGSGFRVQGSAKEEREQDRQQKLAEHWKLTVDPEFKAAQRPLSTDERERLKESLKKHGCRDPVVVCESWEGSLNGGKELTRYVIDGHNRYELCQELRLPFATVRVRLPDRAAVLQWIRSNQLARRNLSPAERDELLAKEYRAEVHRRKAGHESTKTEIAKAGAQVEPHAETVHVPFSKEHRCKASFVLLELEGKWYSFETSENAGGGGCTSCDQRQAKRLTVKQLKEHGAKGFRNREACLLDAAKSLEQIALGQGRKYWPAAALKELRAWRDSLNPKSKKAAAVVAEKHGVSAATVKRAAKADRDADAALTRIADVTRVSRAEVQAIVPRAKAAVLASLPTAELRVALRDRSTTGVRQAIEGAQQRISRQAAKPRTYQELVDGFRRLIDRQIDLLADEEIDDALNAFGEALRAKGAERAERKRLEKVYAMPGGKGRRGARQSQGKARRKPR